MYIHGLCRNEWLVIESPSWLWSLFGSSVSVAAAS